MEFLLGDRQSGKTTEAVFWTLEAENRYLVVHSVQEVKRLESIYKFGRLKDKIVSIGQVENRKLWGKGEIAVAVDNLDLILPQLLGARVGLVTATVNHQDQSIMTRVGAVRRR